jgi:ssDNA-binding replication factor A large subunit
LDRISIRELKPGMKGVKVSGRIESKRKDLRSAYTPHAIAVMRDRTGTIFLNLWRGQIGQVRKGDTVSVKEGFVRMRRGSLELSTWEEVLTVSRRKAARSAA